MIPPITSPQNPRVKQAAKLRERSGRTKQNRIIIDGWRETVRACEAGIALDEIFYDDRLGSSPEHERWLAAFSEAGARCLPVSPRVLEKLAYGQRDEGLVATAATPARTLDDLSLPTTALVIAIEGVEKPGNVGAILRTADAAAVSAVIVADGGTDLYNPNAIRASLGAIFTVPLCAAPAAETREWLKRRELPIFAARVDASRPYWSVDLAQSAAIVLGSESEGLSDVWRGTAVTAIHLPMLGRLDSLNVSTTAAVLVFEALRQRQQNTANRP